jgi:hypothetical protein
VSLYAGPVRAVSKIWVQLLEWRRYLTPNKVTAISGLPPAILAFGYVIYFQRPRMYRNWTDLPRKHKSDTKITFVSRYYMKLEDWLSGRGSCPPSWILARRPVFDDQHFTTVAIADLKTTERNNMVQSVCGFSSTSSCHSCCLRGIHKIQKIMLPSFGKSATKWRHAKI